MPSISDHSASRVHRDARRVAGGFARALAWLRPVVVVFVIGVWPALAATGMAALRWLRRPTRRGVALTLCVPVALCALYVLALIPFTPSIGDIRKAHRDEPARVVSADGRLLAEFKPGNREWVKLSDISPYMIDALISTEDHRFYRHHGLDGWRIASAMLHTFSGARQGGSTLTQQLARNLYPDEIGRAPTLTRKLKEAITALKIESVYNKNEILETYLNTVPFLYDTYGVEMAARTYFGKSASQLDILESATLTGMLKGNSYYNPVLNPERALQRRNTVLAQMVKYGHLSQAGYDALKLRPLGVDFERQIEPPGPAPHFAQQVRRWLITWADRNGYNIYTDGLVVYTTIDSRLQAMATQSLTAQTRQLQTLANDGWNARGGCSLNNVLLKTFMRETPEYRAALAAAGQTEQTGQTGQMRQTAEQTGQAGQTAGQAGAGQTRAGQAGQTAARGVSDAADGEKENNRENSKKNSRETDKENSKENHGGKRRERRDSARHASRGANGADEDALRQLARNRAFMRTLCDGKTSVQAGFLAIDPRDGGIKAWVGSPDFSTEPFDHVQQARRQPGSTFKAFVYGAAFANGAKPDDTYTDRAVDIALEGGGAWQPNDSAPPSNRAVTLRDALTYSRNRITAQLMLSVGPRQVVRLARAMGVRDSALDAVPSLALGTSPVTLKEMVSAYSTIADGGEYREPRMITRIEDRNGKVLATFALPAPQRALQEDAANTLIDVMRDVVDRGTGASIRTRFGIRADVAGKTGTTQDNTDGWFILMDRQLVAGAWVGFDDTRVTPGHAYWGEGARSALPVVGNFFHHALRAKIVDPRTRLAAAPQSRPGFFGRIVAKLRAWFGSLFHHGTTTPEPTPADAPAQAEGRSSSRSLPSSRSSSSGLTGGAGGMGGAGGASSAGPFRTPGAAVASGAAAHGRVPEGLVGASGLRPVSGGGAAGSPGSPRAMSGISDTSGRSGRSGGAVPSPGTAPGAHTAAALTGNAPAIPGASPARTAPGANMPPTGRMPGASGGMALPNGDMAERARAVASGSPGSPGTSGGAVAPPRTAPGGTGPGGMPPFGEDMEKRARAGVSTTPGRAVSSPTPPRIAPMTTRGVPPLLGTGGNPAGTAQPVNAPDTSSSPGNASTTPGAPSSHAVYAPPPSAPAPPPGNAAGPSGFGNAQGGNTSGGLSPN